jgi:hydroxymethylpyrimidine pyrophosphatase-like HAD family hydrolase|tara:strand:- start:91 stop:450 length:360 start_codon:yes stop_codon:yes gene_type:complete
MKTIICDIDGTLVTYRKDAKGIISSNHNALPGVVEKLNRWENQGCKIILITGRRESLRNITEQALVDLGIPFDMLLMGFADTGRVLINDEGSKVKAHSVSLKRDEGFVNFDWETVGLSN